MILVIGASGQLGFQVVRELRRQGRDVRALVRSAGPASEALVAAGAELALGDLTLPSSIERALAGVDEVIVTANVVAPSHRRESQAAFDEGYAALLRLAAAAGVSRLVRPSVPVTHLDGDVPVVRSIRAVDRALESAPFSSLSLRLAPFTELWLPMAGLELVLRGEAFATADRPYPFLRAYRRMSSGSAERRGMLLVPGPSTNRQAFISVPDVARLLVAALATRDMTGAVDVFGPEALSWDEVAAIAAEILGRPVRVRSTPAAVFAAQQRLFSPVAPMAANVMALDRLAASTSTERDTSATVRALGIERLRTVREVLQEKAALPADGATGRSGWKLPHPRRPRAGRVLPRG